MADGGWRRVALGAAGCVLLAAGALTVSSVRSKGEAVRTLRRAGVVMQDWRGPLVAVEFWLRGEPKRALAVPTTAAWPFSYPGQVSVREGDVVAMGGTRALGEAVGELGRAGMLSLSFGTGYAGFFAGLGDGLRVKQIDVFNMGGVFMPDDWEALAGVSGLESVLLVTVEFRDMGEVAFPELRELMVLVGEMDRSFFAGLHGCPALEKLVVSGQGFVPAEAEAVLEGHPSLVEVSLELEEE